MTEETLRKLRNWASRQARMEFERDILILRSRRDGDKMTAIAEASGLSRQHVYRVVDEAEADLNIAEEMLGAELAWSLVDRAKTWKEYRQLVLIEEQN